MTIDDNVYEGAPRFAAPSDLESGGGDDLGRDDNHSRAGRRPGKGIIDIGDSGPGTGRNEREDGRPIAPKDGTDAGNDDVGQA